MCEQNANPLACCKLTNPLPGYDTSAEEILTVVAGESPGVHFSQTPITPTKENLPAWLHT
jgi:hypothetical protein